MICFPACQNRLSMLEPTKKIMYRQLDVDRTIETLTTGLSRKIWQKIVQMDVRADDDKDVTDLLHGSVRPDTAQSQDQPPPAP